MKQFVVNSPMFPFNIVVALGTDPKKLDKFLSKKLSRGDVSFFRRNIKNAKAGKVILFDNVNMLLFLKKEPKTISDLAVLQHEILHCTSFVLNTIGIEFTESTEEVYAYFTSFLTEEIYKKLNIKIGM